MKRSARGLAVVAGLAGLAGLLQAHPAQAHPTPFSTVDVHLDGAILEIALTAHAFDLAHELGEPRPERLLDPAVAATRAQALGAVLAPRLQLLVDGRQLPVQLSAPEVVPERQALRLRQRYDLGTAPTRLTIEAVLFPYDHEHQSFVNLYQADRLVTQAVLDIGHRRVSHVFAHGSGIGSSAGAGTVAHLAVVREFVAAGIHHILIGWDHMLFLVGLLLLGGPWRKLLLVVSAFTVGHSVTLSLAVLGAVNPSARLIEPAIALSIVMVGADNLLARPGGRDLRPWLAAAFGLVHGFGFASVLREAGLPAGALGWSLFSFNLGVEIGQLAVVAVVAVALTALRTRSEKAGRWLTMAGSVAVAAAGAFWFIVRIFSGGTS